MPYKKGVNIASLVLLLSVCSVCSACSAGDSGSSSDEPVYNSARYSAAESAPPNGKPGSASANAPPNKETDAASGAPQSEDMSAVPDSSVGAGGFTSVSADGTARGNSFEEDAGFGHFRAVENGFYYVDLNDGFLYFTDRDGKIKTVLEDYVRALNYYDGYLYYIKGTKEDFLATEYFYAGGVYRLDPVSGEETRLIDVPENMSLNVNEYGIFCNPSGGGLALYGFDGKETERLSDENQGVYFIGNKLLLKKDGKTVLRNFETGEESGFPNDMFLFACIEDRVICARESDQWTKIILNLSTGETSKLPQSAAFTFAVCGGELYAADGDNLYRVDPEKTGYESVISFPQGSPVYFYALHSDGERLYAVMRNQSNASALAEVNTESGELNYLEGQ